jgi:predicted ATPase/class 3 adenylate cyclase
LDTTPLPTGTVTFLFTDIEGSSQLWEQHPDAMRLALARHDACLNAAITSNHGHVFKTVGDAFCAVFATAPDALDAALAAQQNLRALQPSAVPSAAALSLRVRIALHTGAAEARSSDYFGPALNRVARLLAIAHGGQVLLSGATQELVQDDLPPGASLRDLGLHRLRDLQRPEQVYQLLAPDLPADFPPLRSLEAFRHNLPVQLTRFIGREPEMAEVKRLLAATRLLTLTGSGGSGKTRLSLEVAVDLLEEYANGVWLVELAALADPVLVPQTVASALGVREEPGRTLTATLTDYLRPKSLLLVLDNCEHLLSACAQLAESLLRACPKLRILASSREGLGIGGEQTHRVPSLSLPDARHLLPLERLQEFEAVQLFADRAALCQPSFTVTSANAASVVEVCQRLGGIPLAIELAAARLKMLPVEQIVRRLDDRFRLLTGGSRTALPRQQTLQACIDWSYDLLSEPERALLRRLSVFAGGWSLEAAEAVCGGDGVEEGDVLDLLAGLVDKSLVVYEEREAKARYRLPETIRQYAVERLVESGETVRLRQRHLGFYLPLAEEVARHLYRAGQAIYQKQLERDHENLRAALEWSLTGDGGVEAALRLAGALGEFWTIGSHLREGRDWVMKALARGRNAPPLVLARAAIAGSSCAFHCDYELAGFLAEEALRYAREAKDRWAIALALFGVAFMAVGRDEFEEARARAEEGMVLAQEEGDRWLVGRHLVPLGLIAWVRGDYAASRTLFQETLKISRELADEWHIAMTLSTLAFVTRGDGDNEEARALHLEGLPLGQRLGDRRGIGWHLVGMAGVEVEQGRAEHAARLLGAAAAVLDAAGSTLPPILQREHDHTVEQTRSLSGGEAFAAAWAEGRALSLEEAIRYALQEPGADVAAP